MKKIPARSGFFPAGWNRLGVAFLLLLLASCSPGTPAASTPASTVSVLTPVVATAMPGTVSAVTTIIVTAAPIVSTGLPANGTPPPFPTREPATPIPTLPSGASPTELKYKLLEQYPNLFFCDPDFYPVARDDELSLALAAFPALQANPEEFQAILSHNGLTGLTTFTDGQKLLIYREHKKLAAIHFQLSGDQYQFQLQVAESKGQGFVVTGLINGSGNITVQERKPGIATCPICLAAHTLIDTPHGSVAVEDLQVGDAVWTADAAGDRMAATILKTTLVLVPAGHQMIHIVLDDGRELWASPGHPTADGRTLAEFHLGDFLDGGRIVQLERVPYDQPATYDVLPSGGTGWYWANGFLMGSTLKR